MCGIAGFYGREAPEESCLTRMAAALRHRGPDHQGVWSDPGAGIGFAHARLAVVDLSPAGQQPMVSAAGRFVLVLNGEIYNHSDMRAALVKDGWAQAWRGHSDTEVLLAGFEAWGIAGTVDRAVGMFAMAVWDRDLRDLTLIRDRLGEKPLYYGRQGGTFFFGSELKALKAHPSFNGVLDRNAVASYMQFGYVPSPLSIYSGIHKLPAGTMLRISDHGTRDGSPISYWSLSDVARRGQETPFDGTDLEAVTLLDDKLKAAVAGQQMADVPIGAFLSGGVDSSLIVALMQAQSSRPVHTFTIGNGFDSYDESPHAEVVARHLGTDHTVLHVTARDVQDVVPQLPQLYDEPFADSSQVPTLLVSGLARRHVTVSLSGDGGDELFGGYNRYSRSRMFRGAPLGSKTLAFLLRRLTPSQWSAVYRGVSGVLSRRYRSSSPGDHIYKLADVLELSTDAEVYQHLVSIWPLRDKPVPGGLAQPNILALWNTLPDCFDRAARMMVLDALTYLPDDILCKVDRAAMSVSLETRVPFLDHRVVEFAWQLPAHMKIRGGEGKWVVRQLLDRYVPRHIIDRPKMGFGIPIDSWLRGPLRSWAEDLLTPERLRQSAMLDVEIIRARWAEHLSGKLNWQHQMWTVLMFQAWYECQHT